MESKLTKLLLIERNDNTAEKLLEVFRKYKFELNRVKDSRLAAGLIKEKGKFNVYVMDIGEAGFEGDDIPFSGVNELHRLSNGSLFFGYSAQDYRNRKNLRSDKEINAYLMIRSCYDKVLWSGEPFIEQEIIPMIKSQGFDI